MIRHDAQPRYDQPDQLVPVVSVELPDDDDPCVSRCFETGECHGSCGLSRGR